MTKNQFKQQYMEAMGWTDAVVTDEDLMLEYPVCVYHFADGTQVTAVCEEIPAEEVPEEESLENILEALFDMEAVSAQQETVLGFFAPGKIDGEDLPPVMDEDILEELLDALDDDDRVRGEVTMEDDFTASIIMEGHMIAAAGAVLESERFADISLCVHPKMRGRGLGKRVLCALIKRIQAAGCEPVYRVEDTNVPSVRLARRAGLAVGFTMDGALLSFLEEE